MNFIASHPNVCMLAGETHEIFYGKHNEPLRKWIHRFLYLPLFLMARQHIFFPYFLEKRRRLPKLATQYIDILFYFNKLTAKQNRYKADGIKYTKNEIKKAILLCKNSNGLVFATDLFAEMYQKHTFVALIRDGLALCEGYNRRGMDVKKIAIMYEKVCQEIIECSEKIVNFHIVRFEDMISKPTSFIRKIYGYAGLDMNDVPKYRLSSKIISKEGNRIRKVHWLTIDEIKSYFRKDINENKIAKLSGNEKHIFLQHASNSMKFFGYI